MKPRWEVAIAIAMSFFLSSAPRPAHAAIIGGINPSGPNALAQQLESFYFALLSSGQVPVRYVTVEEGDSIEKILRREAAFRGGFFPVVLDALSCDLNSTVCRRSLTRKGASGVLSVANPLELELTPGNWMRLKPGSQILIPQLHIEQNVVSKPHTRTPGETIEALISDNDACAGENMSPEDCRSLFEYMNYTIRNFQSPSYTGPMFVPGYNYIVTISPTCADVCARVTDPIIADLERDIFLQGPFDLQTSNPDVAAESEAKAKADVEAKGGKVTPPPGITYRQDIPSTQRSLDTNRTDTKALPSTVTRKLDAGKRIISQKKWKSTAPAERYTDPTLDPASDFDTENQSSTLAGINYPAAKMSVLQKTVDSSGTNQSVMIIDSQFDKDHCEFANNIRVYDCRNKDRKYADQCILDSANFTYASAGASDADPATRELCGAAGVVSVESPVQAETYIAPRHGTHLAGIIASQWDDFGAGGINPFATIIGVEADMERLSDEAYGKWLLKRIKQIMWREKVRVVNFSAGYALSAQTETSGELEPGQDWLTTLIQDNKDQAIFIVAAGNKPDPACQTIPACVVDRQKNLVTVVALNNAGSEIWSNASTNPKFSVGAPAEQVFAAAPMNRYVKLSGSSQSAAIVAGTASLAMSLGTGALWPPAVIRNRLIACSNAKKASLLSKMQGGAVDVDCFVNGTNDQAKVDGHADVLLGNLVSTSNPSFSVQFSGIETGDETLDAGRIIGFQRVGGNASDIILYYSKTLDLGSGQLERKRGNFKPGQSLNFKIGDDIEPIELGRIAKFVRRSS
jgi:hypothetical protein